MGFELTSSNFRTAAIPGGLSSQLESRFIHNKFTRDSRDNLTFRHEDVLRFDSVSESSTGQHIKSQDASSNPTQVNFSCRI